MRTLTLCLLALALTLPSVAMAQKKPTAKKAALQLVLGGDKAVSGVQYPVFVFKLPSKSGQTKALIVNARTKASAQKRLAAATGLPESAFAKIEPGTIVKPGGPSKNDDGLRLEQDGIHLARYNSVMSCDVDIRSDCTAPTPTLGTTISNALSGAEVKAAVGSTSATSTKAKAKRKATK